MAQLVSDQWSTKGATTHLDKPSEWREGGVMLCLTCKKADKVTNMLMISHLHKLFHTVRHTCVSNRDRWTSHGSLG